MRDQPPVPSDPFSRLGSSLGPTMCRRIPTSHICEIWSETSQCGWIGSCTRYSGYDRDSGNLGISQPAFICRSRTLSKFSLFVQTLIATVISRVFIHQFALLGSCFGQLLSAIHSVGFVGRDNRSICAVHGAEGDDFLPRDRGISSDPRCWHIPRACLDAHFRRGPVDR